MFLHGERPAYIDQLSARLKKLSVKLFESLPLGRQVHLHSTSDLYELESNENLFILRNGSLSAHFENRLCLYFESGDLIGLTNCYQIPSFRVVVENSVEALQYDADTLLRHVNESKERQAIWTSYLITQISLFQCAYGSIQLKSSLPQTGFLDFMDGQVIINQGDEATEVFTILSGQANVFVDGTNVGKIQQDEIFGAMAVFTNEKRSATVKAVGECVVLAVPKKDFIVLIHSHPQTTMTLIENMARTICTLNAQLTADDKS